MPRKKRKNNPVKAWMDSIDPVAARRVGGAALFIAVCGGIATGLALLAARVEERSRQNLAATPVAFEFDWPRGGEGGGEGESWLPEAFRADLRHLASLHMGTNDPLSPQPIARLGRALEASGWFDDRPLIRREPGGVVHITGSWRVPVAAVRVMGNDLPVSRAGKIMPIPYEVGQSDMAVVFGMQGLPPLNRDGSLNFAARWDARDLEAGLELLDLLRREPYFERIVGVDVGEFASRGQLALLIDTGSRVWWGGRASTYNPAEMPTPAKLQRLGKLFEQGSLDEAGAVYHVYHEHAVFKEEPPVQGEG